MKKVGNDKIRYDEDDHHSITILDGNKKAYIGDYIIKDENGMFYPCKSDIFEKNYESIADYKVEQQDIDNVL